jgi:sec-independent protein translocase protein TatC
MSSRPNDDLFQNSTMSFGEHLEELRGALFRSVIGIAIGFLLGLLMARHVVRMIETPLKNGLRAHYAALSVEKLEAGEYGDTGPEQWSLLTEERLVPQRITVDADSFRAELHRIFPDVIPQAPSVELPFTLDSLPLKSSNGLLKTWHSASQARRDSYLKELWNQLPADTQSQLAGRVDLETEFESTQQVLLQSLNDLAKTSPPTTALPYLQRLFPDESHGNYFRGQLTAAEETASDASLNLNRQLMQAGFRGFLKAPTPETLELTTWQPIDVDVQALSVHEPFMVFIKAAVILGLIFSSPWVFYQIWMFVAAGLYPQERNLVYKFMPISFGLFIAGAALAFFFVFEPVLDFLFQFNRMLHINAEPRITDWLSFVLILPLGFGVSFQLPLVMVLLERIGIFTIENYVTNWRIAVLVIFVLSMFLTPADPISMLLMAVPLTGLYFGGIWLCRSIGTAPRSPIGAGYDP